MRQIRRTRSVIISGSTATTRGAKRIGKIELTLMRTSFDTLWNRNVTRERRTEQKNMTGIQINTAANPGRVDFQTKHGCTRTRSGYLDYAIVCIQINSRMIRGGADKLNGRILPTEGQCV